MDVGHLNTEPVQYSGYEISSGFGKKLPVFQMASEYSGDLNSE